MRRVVPPYTVLIGDVDPPRIELFRTVLEERYRSDLIISKDWDGFREELARKDIDLVILYSDLPGQYEKKLKAAVDEILNGKDYFGSVIGVHLKNYTFSHRSKKVSGLPWTSATTRDDVEKALAVWLPDPPLPPSVSLSDHSDFLLEQQVRGLDRGSSLERGLEQLGKMIGDLDFRPRLDLPYQSARVGRLTQGFSGALVFRLEVESQDRRGVYVLKIVRGDSNRSKLEREIEYLPTVYETLGLHNLTAYVPALIKPWAGIWKEKGLVGSGDSFAVCYQFLGDPIGHFPNLEAVYLEYDPRPPTTGHVAASTMDESDPARVLIDQLIGILRRAWYEAAPNGGAARAAASPPSCPLWSSDDTPSRDNREFPPYRMTAWEKATILAALDELDGFGRRLLGDRKWNEEVLAIKTWLGGTHPLLLSLAKERPTMLSCVHGDLNAKNILLWTDENRPFLIDFACFQPRGHVMQDFARLEVEVKLILMEREKGVDDPALDHSPGRLPVWCLVERDLTSLDWATASIPLEGRERFVKRAVDIVREIRTQAQTVRGVGSEDGIGEKGFLLEYGSALLYHTLRAIGYDSLSPFKRLLAVFSAALWMGFLDRCHKEIQRV